MEIYTIILLLSIAAVILFAILACAIDGDLSIWSYLAGCAFMIVIFIMASKDASITIKKSTDSEWEKTSFHKTETTIDTLYFNNKQDTVYRTIQYINVKL